MKSCQEKNCQSQEALRKELFKLVGAIVARNGNRFREIVAQNLMTSPDIAYAGRPQILFLFHKLQNIARLTN